MVYLSKGVNKLTSKFLHDSEFFMAEFRNSFESFPI